jgi:hypothetical protein
LQFSLASVNQLAARGLPAMAALFRVGDVIVVRSLSDILRTLDGDSALDGVPFMPEMSAHCGRTFRVSRRLERTCVEQSWRPRAFPDNDVVYLEELRCDGAAHGGCQRGCMLLWKEAWLEPAAAGSEPARTEPAGDPSSGALIPILKTRAGDRYYCQSTELHRATTALSNVGRVLSFVREVLAGNRTAWQMADHIVRPVLRRVRRRWIDDDPRGVHATTPTVALDLEPGDLVRIRPRAELDATLDRSGKNRGLGCPFAYRAFAGRELRVRSRLERMISESTGQMRQVRHTVSLESVRCQCHYVTGGCPRRELLYWREIWLERVTPSHEVRRHRAG